MTILSGVGLADLDGLEKGQLVERLAGRVGDQLGLSPRGCGKVCSPRRWRSAWT